MKADASRPYSDNTLLRQAFGAAVHCRMNNAKEWRQDREVTFIHKELIEKTSTSTENTCGVSKFRGLWAQQKSKKRAHLYPAPLD